MNAQLNGAGRHINDIEDYFPELSGGEFAAVSEAESIDSIQVNNRHRHQIAADCITILSRLNGKTLAICKRGSELVRMHPDRGETERVTVPILSGMMDREVAFYTSKSDANGTERRLPARPPNDVIVDVLTQPDLPLPELVGISHSPVFVPPGRILARPGYDRDSGMYLTSRVSGVSGVPFSSVRQAASVLRDDLLGDFPFADQAGVAHTFALLLLPMVRQLIAGPTPMTGIFAPARGSGKGLLTDICAMVALGEPADVLHLPNDGDELEKRITALLLASSQFILLDNVTRLGPPALCAVLTTEKWRGRILGESRVVTVPNHAVWVATGNNCDVNDEMVRRIVSIRLDSGVERPEERTGFRHPDLMEYVRANRSLFVSACLKLVQEWIDAGKPSGTKTLGRFESWARVIGGILDVAGIDGFLADRDWLHSTSDQESQEWIAFSRAWWTAYESRPVTAGDLFAVVRSANLLLDLWGGRAQIAATQRLGHALQSRRDRVFDGFRIVSAGRNARSGSSEYRLVRLSPKTPETPQTCDLSEESAVNDGQKSGVSGVSSKPPARGKCFACPKSGSWSDEWGKYICADHERGSWDGRAEVRQ